MNPSRLEAGRACLVVVDVQEAFRRYHCFSRVAANAAKLLVAARLLGLPRIVTEQYPQGLGRTVPEVGLDGEQPLPKRSFSAARAEGFSLGGRDQVVLCGLETHVCVGQTVLDLLGQGVGVYLIADAVGSRHRIDHLFGLRRLAAAGATVTTTEAVLFELLEGADHPQFKAIQGLVK